MKRLIALVLCWPVWVGATDWYVRPASAEYGAEDGTSYATAFDGFADVVWGGAGIVAGDTLYVCGSFGAESKDDTTNYITATTTSGSDGSPITIDGDCSANETNPSSWTNPVTGTSYTGAKLDVEGGNAAGIRVGNVTWYVIKNLEITGATEYGIRTWVGGAEAATDKNIIIDGVWVHDNTSSDNGTGDSLISVFGGKVTVKNSILENAPGDGLFANGANLTATDNYIVNVGTGSSEEGDCIQNTTNTDGTLIDGNKCDHTSQDEKQCYIVNGSSDNGAFTVTDNICLGYAGASTMGGCYYLESTGAWRAERNFASGCDYGYNIANMGATSIFGGNIAVSPTSVGIRVGVTVTAANVENNSVYGTTGIGLQSDTAGTSIAFRNNAASGFPTCIDAQDGDNVDVTNACYGYTTGKSLNGTADTLSGDTITGNPLFISATPDTALEFKLQAGSPLRGAGTYTDSRQDHGNRRFKFPPSIGAWEAASGDAASSRQAAQSR